MAPLNLFRFAAVPARPRSFGGRLALYFAFSLLAWAWPPWGALATLLAIGVLGHHLRWLAWLRALGWLWIFVLAPPALALAPPSPAPALPAVWRSLTFLSLLAASQWLSATTTLFEIRAGLAALFRLFGKRLAEPLSLAGALALAFLPWVLEQVHAARQAGALRGVPPRRPLLALRALSVPVFARMVEKARHTAEALELRGR